MLYQKVPINKRQISLNYVPQTSVYRTVYYAVELASMSKPPQTYLGRYLLSLREQRGFDNIQEYVRRHNLPVSYVYYTEIESGKKRIALETSKQLCAALEADQISFFYHLLKDILPENIQTEFLNRIPIQNLLNSKEKEEKAQKIQKAHQKNLLARLHKTIFYMSKEAGTFISKNARLNLLITAIYCVRSTSDKELQYLAQRLNIDIPIEDILKSFEELEIIKISQSSDKKLRIIMPAHDIIVTTNSQVIADIINNETKIAALESSKHAFTGANQDNCFHGMIGLSKQKQEELHTYIADLVAEFNACHLENSDGVPQLMTIIFSPAKEYGL